MSGPKKGIGMTSVGDRCDKHGAIYKWTDHNELDTMRQLEEKDQLRGEILSLRMNLDRISSELDTEKSLRTMADQQLRHALSLLRDSVSNFMSFATAEFSKCIFRTHTSTFSQLWI